MTSTVCPLASLTWKTPSSAAGTFRFSPTSSRAMNATALRSSSHTQKSPIRCRCSSVRPWILYDGPAEMSFGR